MPRNLNPSESQRVDELLAGIKQPPGSVAGALAPLQHLRDFCNADHAICHGIAKNTTAPAVLAAVILAEGSDVPVTTNLGSSKSVISSPAAEALSVIKLLVGHGHTRRSYQPLSTAEVVARLLSIATADQQVSLAGDALQHIVDAVDCVLLEEDAESFRGLWIAAGAPAILVQSIASSAAASAAGNEDFTRITRLLSALLASLCAGEPAWQTAIVDAGGLPILVQAVIAAQQESVVELSALIHSALVGNAALCAALVPLGQLFSSLLATLFQRAANSDSPEQQSSSEVLLLAIATAAPGEFAAGATAATSNDVVALWVAPVEDVFASASCKGCSTKSAAHRVAHLRRFGGTLDTTIRVLKHQHLETDAVAASLVALEDAYTVLPTQLTGSARMLLRIRNGPGTMRAMLGALANVDEMVSAKAAAVLAHVLADPPSLRAFVAGDGVELLGDVLYDYSDEVLTAAATMLQHVVVSPLGWRSVVAAGMVKRIDRILAELVERLSGDVAAATNGEAGGQSGLGSVSNECAAVLQLIAQFPTIQSFPDANATRSSLQRLLVLSIIEKPNDLFPLCPRICGALATFFASSADGATHAIAVMAPVATPPWPGLVEIVMVGLQALPTLATSEALAAASAQGLVGLLRGAIEQSCEVQRAAQQNDDVMGFVQAVAPGAAPFLQEQAIRLLGSLGSNSLESALVALSIPITAAVVKGPLNEYATGIGTCKIGEHPPAGLIDVLVAALEAFAPLVETVVSSWKSDEKQDCAELVTAIAAAATSAIQCPIVALGSLRLHQPAVRILAASSTNAVSRQPLMPATPALLSVIQACEEYDDGHESATMTANLAFKTMLTLGAAAVPQLSSLAAAALDVIVAGRVPDTAAWAAAFAPIPMPVDTDEAHDVLVAAVPLINGILHHDPASREAALAHTPALLAVAAAPVLEVPLRVVALYALWNVLERATPDVVQTAQVLLAGQEGVPGLVAVCVHLRQCVAPLLAQSDPTAGREAVEALYMSLERVYLLLSTQAGGNPLGIDATLFEQLCVDATAGLPKAAELLLTWLQEDPFRHSVVPALGGNAVPALRAALQAIDAAARTKAGPDGTNNAAAYISMQTSKYLAELQ